jgi:hypothetical protein
MLLTLGGLVLCFKHEYKQQQPPQAAQMGSGTMLHGA